MSTLLRTSGVALLLLLLFVVILAAMPLPSAKPRFTTPEWITYVDIGTLPFRVAHLISSVLV